MKAPKIKNLFLISNIALCLLASLAGVLVCESKLPYMVKYSFIMILAAGLCVLLALLLNAYARFSEHQNDNLLVKMEEDLKTVKEKKQAAETEVQKASAELHARKKELQTFQTQENERNARPLPCEADAEKTPFSASETELLRRKCETIENFRNSFPYRINDGYILYNIMRTEIQVSGYSRWQLVGEFDEQLWEYALLRPDTQSYKEMLSLAAATSAPEELKQLNVSDQLLWN